MTTSPASLAEFVPPGTPDADDHRFKSYSFDHAKADARAVGSALSTGFATIDAQDFRFVRGAMYAVLGRPGEGKTALLLEFAARQAERLRTVPAGARGPAVFVTFEETLLRIYLRLIRREIGRHAIEQGQRPEAVAQDVVERWLADAPDSELKGHAGELSRARDVLDSDLDTKRLVLLDGDGPLVTVDALAAFLRRAASEEGIPPSLVVLDYFQKIRGAPGLYYSSGQSELQATAGILLRYAKGTAIDTDRHIADEGDPVPLVVGSQVNREAVTSEGATEPPDLHHIRGGDDLANDASGVLTLCRPDGELKLRVAKNRDGRRNGTFSLSFDGPTRHIYEGSTASGSSRLAQLARGK